MFILERTIGAGFPPFPSQPREEERCAGEIEGWRDSPKPSRNHYSSVSLDLVLCLSELGGGRLEVSIIGWSLGIKWKQHTVERVVWSESLAEWDRGRDTEFQGQSQWFDIR